MRWFLVILVMVLFSCSPERWADKAEQTLAVSAIDNLRLGRTAAFERQLHPAIRAQVRGVLPQMRAAVPDARSRPQLLGFSQLVSGNQRQTQLQYALDSSTKHAIVDVVVLHAAGQSLLTTFYIHPTPAPASELNGFAEGEAGAKGWAMIAAMIAALLVTIAALIKIWRRPFRHRWLWTLGAISGVTAVRLNWATGDFTFQPLAFQLFSAAMVKMPIYAPWILTVSIPLIAVIALVRTIDPEATQLGS